MVDFDLWGESFVFASVFSMLVLVPCLVIALIGRKMIKKLSYYPSQAPQILMSISLQFTVTAVITLSLLFAFFKVFTE